MKGFTYYLLVFLTFFIVGCQHDPVFVDETGEICFDQQILPLLQTSCGISGCHDAGTASEGFAATDYASIMKIVTPGDVKGSKLYNVITDINGENFMPPDNPLTQNQRMLIHLWIAGGAQETKCNQASNPGNNPGTNPQPVDTITFVQDILPLLQSSCATTGCHDNITHEEDIRYTSYEGVMNSGTVDAFRPDNSEMIEKITDDEPDDRMPPPPLSALTSEQISQLKKWISDGALNSSYIDASCDTAGTIEFLTEVWPVIQNNCVGCHNNTVTNGNVNLNGYEFIKKQAETTKNGISLLKGVITHAAGFVGMPPAWQLAHCDIRKIELWIEQGRLNN